MPIWWREKPDWVKYGMVEDKPRLGQIWDGGGRTQIESNVWMVEGVSRLDQKWDDEGSIQIGSNVGWWRENMDWVDQTGGTRQNHAPTSHDL